MEMRRLFFLAIGSRVLYNHIVFSYRFSVVSKKAYLYKPCHCRIKNRQFKKSFYPQQTFIYKI